MTPLLAIDSLLLFLVPTNVCRGLLGLLKVANLFLDHCGLGSTSHDWLTLQLKKVDAGAYNGHYHDAHFYIVLF